ncbi:helix-turn-helix domain-containing protein [Limibaculum sp. M0105]|uniref:Helix-turn-helix domain-containing protein n=2 Tax=Thermohalobaculum xanthum TaxID=2753746 RepID=A0A8J7SJD2_9RHOB|nr:helix-turn-helix domain-containing protein [Thermohalobaculum xanthum]
MTDAHVDGYPWEQPEAPVPLAPLFTFLGKVAEREGLIDLGCRSLVAETLRDFGVTGNLVIGSRTPREALLRIARAMPWFCTHERIAIGAERGCPVVYTSFTGPFDPGGVHIAQQMTASLMAALVPPMAPGEPALLRVEIAPWAPASLDQLRAHLCDEVVEARSNVLALHFRKGSLDRPYPAPLDLKGPAPRMPLRWLRLGEEASLVEAVGVYLDEMLVEGTPTIDDAARAIMLSRRTLQRVLAENGTSFRELLDDVRRRRAIAEIEASSEQIGMISARLGYSSQACLSRAVRRWTDQTARDLRGATGDSREGAGARTRPADAQADAATWAADAS